MQVYPLIGWNTCIALRRPLHSVDTSNPCRGTIWLDLRLRDEIRSRDLFLFAPGAHPREHRLDRLVRAAALPCAQRGNLGALVFLSKPVLEAVLAITVRAAHAGIFQCVDERFARDMGALVGVVDVGPFGRSTVLFLVGCTVAPTGPFTGVRALVGGFGAVVEAEGASAGFAAKGEEVELSTVFKLAVAADRFEICVGHLGVGFPWCKGGGSPFGYADGRHDNERNEVVRKLVKRTRMNES